MRNKFLLLLLLIGCKNHREENLALQNIYEDSIEHVRTKIRIKELEVEYKVKDSLATAYKPKGDSAIDSDLRRIILDIGLNKFILTPEGDSLRKLKNQLIRYYDSLRHRLDYQ